MMKPIIRNLLILIVVSGVGGVYYSKYASTIPQEWILVTNFILVPAGVGALTYFLFVGECFTRLALVGAIPTFSILLAGGDPAKSGLELGLIGPLLVVSMVGAGVSAVVDWFLRFRQSRQG